LSRKLLNSQLVKIKMKDKIMKSKDRQEKNVLLDKITKSRTKIDRQAERKLNPELAETIILTKKNEAWLPVASLLSYPRRKQISKNLDEIDKESREGDTIIVPGKVLGNGEVSKKIRVVGISFSKSAREKLKARKCEIVSILEEIKVNPKANGLKILK